MSTSILSYSDVKKAVADSAAAFRLKLRLEPVSPKVFPPTYEGGKYATEERIIDGDKLPCVLLDAVASNANRMEVALQDAVDAGEIQIPVISANFAVVNNPAIPRVTSFQAPHRIFDAIFRDSLCGKQKFRETNIGKELDRISSAYATPLFQYSPHSLVYGIWDSTGPRGGLGIKFSRAIISEIIGVNAVPGKKTSSRIDPLNIQKNSGLLYVSEEGGWTLAEATAAKTKEGKEKGKAIRLGKEGKPSEANHGNVTPSISDGGFTIQYAEQTTVLSLPALRRLRFPLKAGEKSTPEADTVARTYLAAIGLLGVTLAIDAGYDLRSRCVLWAKEPVVWSLLGKPGEQDKRFSLDKQAAIAIYNDALSDVQKAKLPIHLEEIVLTPSDDLVTLVKKSMELAAATGGEE